MFLENVDIQHKPGAVMDYLKFPFNFHNLYLYIYYTLPAISVKYVYILRKRSQL